MTNEMPRVGDKIRFLPSAFIDDVAGNGKKLDCFGEFRGKVTGTVTYINRPHRFFRVEFTVNGYTMGESFKF